METGPSSTGKIPWHWALFVCLLLPAATSAAQSGDEVRHSPSAQADTANTGEDYIGNVAALLARNSADVSVPGRVDPLTPASYSGSLAHPALSSFEITPKMLALRPAPAPIVVEGPPPDRFHWKGALTQSFEYLMLQHVFRFANDPSLRYSLAHSPFFHNWFASYGGYDLKRWSDGDSFLVNGIGHPLQGAVASRIFIQNTPKGGSLEIGKDGRYWTNRLKGMAWAAVFEVQWKVGPLSETSIGNAGGWLYVPSCGFESSCLNNPKYKKPPTNNTGLSDWILTPVMGTGWVMLEDALDKYLVTPIARDHRIIGGMVLRTALEPSRSFAGLFAGKLPWRSPAPERYVIQPGARPKFPASYESDWKTNRRSVGIHFTSLNLPGVRDDCVGCRGNYAGIGIVYGYRILPSLYLDTEVNYFPLGASDSGPTLEGLFGTKFGHQGKNWGLFGKVRPGFIYYEKAWPGRGAAEYDNLSRFALDAGGVVEVYPSRRSTVRFDIGTTLVRYLRDYPNPRQSQIGTLQSPDYYVNQGNFQITSGYVLRF